MATNSSTFNPYQPPAVVSDAAALAPDTEFLFNDKVVAGVGRIVLPRICVVTGATDRLVAHESRLWWCSQWITTTRSILILAAMFGGIPMLMHLPPRMTVLPPWPGIEEAFQLNVGAALIALAVGFVAASIMFRKSIDVRWFISESYHRRSSYKRWMLALLAIAVTAANWFFFNARDWSVMALPMIWVMGCVVQVVRGRRPLFVAGTLDGLFLIGGLSEKFLAKTERLVAAYALKDR